MKRLQGPTSIKSALVGAALLSCCLILLAGISSASSIMGSSSLGKLNDHYSRFSSPSPDKFDFEKHQPPSNRFSFAESSWHLSGLYSFKEAQKKELAEETEEIVMEGPVAHETVQDLDAFNTKKERTMVYDDSQSGSPIDKGLGNSMDIMINADKKMDQVPDSWPFRNLTVLGAAASDKSGLVYENWPMEGTEFKGFVNYMNIEVRDITVTATNTVPGGSAVATSNIIIKPVQQIVCPSEVEEKLK